MLLVFLSGSVACNLGRSSPVLTTISTATPVPEGLFVDTAQKLGTINPLVYGTNYGPWMKLPLSLRPKLEEAGLTYLRFPGGNWGDENNLQPGQIDQFIHLARQIGAQPGISVRLRGGTPEAAAALVEYTNVTRQYDVRFWSIGNEPGLYPDYDIDQYNADWRTFAQAMSAVDPNILLIGPDIHQYTGDSALEAHAEANRAWLRTFLRANGDLVDIVAIHRYPFPKSEWAAPATIEALRANSREWDTIIPNLRADIQETVGHDLPVAVTEVNSHWTDATGGEATPDSLYNAIWWSDVLGRLIQQRVDLVAHFALQTDTPNGGWGIVARHEVRPIYYVYQLYRHFGDELVYAASDDRNVSIYAALRKDKTLTVILINLGPDEKIKPLRIEGDRPLTPSEVWLFDSRHEAEKVDQLALIWGDKIILPAQSASLLVFDPSPKTKFEDAGSVFGPDYID